MSGAQTELIHTELIHKGILMVALCLLTAAFTLQPVLSRADEAADIARILELNDVYAEAGRAWRAKEISRTELRERQQAIQAESRQIHARHGSAGSQERRAWDRAVRQAKNAYAKQKRSDARAAKAETAAEEWAEREAEQAAAARKAEAQAAELLEDQARLTAQLRT